jgi:chemotaxis protein histidine kinase CheA
MASGQADEPKVATFKDHQVITPDTQKLRRTVRAAMPGEPDQVEAAEQALRRLSSDFHLWMNDECDQLDAARRTIKDGALSKETSEVLFLAAHNIKGDGATFGFPEVARAADSLCRLIEHTPELANIPMTIIDQHVDAIRAIVREHDREDIAKIADTLTQTLRAVTNEFLLAENQHRPDVLRIIREQA